MLFLKSSPITDSIQKPVKNNKKPSFPKNTKTGVQQRDTKETVWLETLYQREKENFSENEPKPKFVWVHITCVLFIPELYFKDSLNVTNIGGIENLDRERFDQECELCELKGCGAVITCAKSNCKKVFHAECARQSGYYLESKENEQGQFVYHIYCDKHIPLKLKRIIESRENKMREEIERFFKAVEKYYVLLLNKPKNIDLTPTPAILQNIDKSSLLKKKKKHRKKDDNNYFMNLVEKYRVQNVETPSTITLQRIPTKGSKNLYEITDMLISKPHSQKDRKLHADDEIWAAMPYKTLTPEQKYKKYRKLLVKMRAKKLRGLKLTSKSAMTKANNVDSSLKDTSKREKRNIKSTYNTRVPQQKNTVYCFCARPYNGELMIACQKCEEWYHPECVGIPNDANMKKLNWFCKKCRQKDGLNEGNLLTEKTIGIKNSLKRVRKDSVEEEEEGSLLRKKLKTEKKVQTQSGRGYNTK
jgi:hypothetical protein